MTEEVTLRIDRLEGAGRNFAMTVAVSETMMQHFKMPLVRAMLEEIEKRLVDAWIERHGAEVLDSLSPQVIAEAVRTQVAKKVFG